MRPPAEKLGRDIGPVRPGSSLLLSIKEDLAEQASILEWLEEFAPKIIGHIDFTPVAIGELRLEDIVVQIPDPGNSQLIGPRSTDQVSG